MKLSGILIALALLQVFFSPALNGCTATLTECNESCTIAAPTGGSASCYTQNNTAFCIAYDENLIEVGRNTATCSSGGSSGPGGDGNWNDPDCQIYWWTCTSAN